MTAAAVLGLSSGAISCLRVSGGSPSWWRSLSWRLSLETAVKVSKISLDLGSVQPFMFGV